MTNPAIIGLNADPDGDGTDNGVENYFGTNPATFTPGLIANPFSQGTNSLTATHPMATSPASDLSHRYQWSPNLLDWYAANGADGPAGGPTATTTRIISGSTASVTATISTPLPRFFLRVAVEQN